MLNTLNHLDISIIAIIARLTSTLMFNLTPSHPWSESILAQFLCIIRLCRIARLVLHNLIRFIWWAYVLGKALIWWMSASSCCLCFLDWACFWFGFLTIRDFILAIPGSLGYRGWGIRNLGWFIFGCHFFDWTYHIEVVSDYRMVYEKEKTTFICGGFG